MFKRLNNWYDGLQESNQFFVAMGGMLIAVLVLNWEIIPAWFRVTPITFMVVWALSRIRYL